MPYESVDRLQKVLTEKVFHYARDSKKAAGRALGTMVEIITFYLLKTWGMGGCIAIERPLPEYLNKEIAHNVEYSLHPFTNLGRIEVPCGGRSISCRRILNALRASDILKDPTSNVVKSAQLLTTEGVLRNACTVCETGTGFIVANLAIPAGQNALIDISLLQPMPFAIVECKRVGVEEGTRKGPQTIEKAKQGAYVARSVSSLQKFRLADGRLGGIIHRGDGTVYLKPHADLLREILCSDSPDLLRDFVLTVGVVSNHGNWFTSENHNKELKILAQSYDWLLFLTDIGLAEFVTDLILRPAKCYSPVRRAFLDSYHSAKSGNRFTKVQMELNADASLQSYFHDNIRKVERWFNIITPRGGRLAELRRNLDSLAAKQWSVIHP